MHLPRLPHLPHLLRAATLALFAVLAGSTAGASSANAGVSAASGIETTQRNIQGIITAVEPTSLTIAPVASQKRHTVTGKIDPKRTRLLVDGKLSKISDLQITFTAQAELGLDDVWVTVRADSTP